MTYTGRFPLGLNYFSAPRLTAALTQRQLFLFFTRNRKLEEDSQLQGGSVWSGKYEKSVVAFVQLFPSGSTAISLIERINESQRENSMFEGA